MRNSLLKSLRFNYLWSNPEAGNDVLLAAAVSRPRFDDLLTLAVELGPDALLDAWRRVDAYGWDRPAARDLSARYIRILHEAHQAALDARKSPSARHTSPA